MDRNVLDERERLIAYFQTHEEERIQVLTRVNEVKKIWKMSIADYIDALKDVDRRGRGKYPLLAGLSAAAIVATLIRPIPCMFLLLLMLCVSAVVHTRDSKRIERKSTIGQASGGALRLSKYGEMQFCDRVAGEE